MHAWGELCFIACKMKALTGTLGASPHSQQTNKQIVERHSQITLYCDADADEKAPADHEGSKMRTTSSSVPRGEAAALYFSLAVGPLVPDPLSSHTLRSRVRGSCVPQTISNLGNRGGAGNLMFVSGPALFPLASQEGGSRGRMSLTSHSRGDLFSVAEQDDDDGVSTSGHGAQHSNYRPQSYTSVGRP